VIRRVQADAADWASSSITNRQQSAHICIMDVDHIVNALRDRSGFMFLTHICSFSREKEEI
jgi:hypothetical protein